MTYSRTRAGVTIGRFALYGAVYSAQSTTSSAVTVPVNGTSYNEAVSAQRTLFAVGDVITLTVSATGAGGTIVAAPTGVAAVFIPLLL